MATGKAAALAGIYDRGNQKQACCLPPVSGAAGNRLYYKNRSQSMNAMLRKCILCLFTCRLGSIAVLYCRG